MCMFESCLSLLESGGVLKSTWRQLLKLLILARLYYLHRVENWGRKPVTRHVYKEPLLFLVSMLEGAPLVPFFLLSSLLVMLMCG